MIYGAYSFLDMKTGHFSPPFFVAHDGQAVRAALELGQDLNTTVGRHPHDFSLVKLGEWNDQSGEFLNTGNHGMGVVASFLPVRQPVFPFPAAPNGTEPNRQPHANGHAPVDFIVE